MLCRDIFPIACVSIESVRPLPPTHGTIKSLLNTEANVAGRGFDGRSYDAASDGSVADVWYLPRSASATAAFALPLFPRVQSDGRAPRRGGNRTPHDGRQGEAHCDDSVIELPILVG